MLDLDVCAGRACAAGCREGESAAKVRAGSGGCRQSEEGRLYKSASVVVVSRLLSVSVFAARSCYVQDGTPITVMAQTRRGFYWISAPGTPELRIGTGTKDAAPDWEAADVQKGDLPWAQLGAGQSGEVVVVVVSVLSTKRGAWWGDSARLRTDDLSAWIRVFVWFGNGPRWLMAYGCDEGASAYLYREWQRLHERCIPQEVSDWHGFLSHRQVLHLL
jgi:hypothetical protein